MTLLLTNQVNSDSLSSISNALYSLICCYQEQYQQLVLKYLSTQTDPQTGQRLAASFTDLTKELSLVNTQKEAHQFSNNFNEFIINMRGLMVK